MERQPKILVVDDTPINIKLLEAVFAHHGYTVVAASSGREALEVVEAQRPDLVLLDVVMPGMDGYEVCRRLRDNPATHLLPVVMITASDEHERLRALEVGADDFVYKPFNQPELLARVRSLVRIKAYQDTIQAQAAALAEWNRSLEARVQQQVAELERLERLRRFLSPQLAELVVASGDDTLLDSHRREIAVAFCALRGFAAFVETTEPEIVMAVLRDYHATMGAEIFRFGGTVGQIAGDGLMVFFNDPLACPDAAARVVRMLLAMREQMDLLSSGWRKHGWELGFGAGVDLGYATLGTIGFEGRIDYGAIGTVTNLAARLCEAASGGQILVNQRVHAAVEALVEATCLGELTLPGLVKPVLAFNVEGARAGADLGPSAGALPTPLTRREEEVAVLVARGLTNRQIAEQLVVSERTVDSHVEHVRTKLGLRSRAHLAAWAGAHGLV